MKQIAKLKDEARKFEQREEWEKAIHAYSEVLRLGEGGDGAELDLPLYNRVGDLYVRLGRSAEAVKYYEQAADKYAESGLYNNAIALCNKALRYDAGRVELLKKLGHFSASQGFFTDARRWYLEYCERMSKRGAIDQAFLALSELADLHDNPEIRELLARQLRDHGRPEQAVAEFRRAYALRAGSGQTAEAKALRAEIQAIDPAAVIEMDSAPQVAAAETHSSVADELPGFLDVDKTEKVAFDGPSVPDTLNVETIQIDTPVPDYAAAETAPETEHIDLETPIGSHPSDLAGIDLIDIGIEPSLEFTPPAHEPDDEDTFDDTTTTFDMPTFDLGELQHDFADVDLSLPSLTDDEETTEPAEPLPGFEEFEAPGAEEEDTALPLVDAEPEESLKFSFDEDDAAAEPMGFEFEPPPEPEPEFPEEPEWVKETLPSHPPEPVAEIEELPAPSAFEPEPEPEFEEPEPISFEPEPAAFEPEPSSFEPEPSSFEPEPEPVTEIPFSAAPPPAPRVGRPKDDYVDLASFLADDTETTNSTRFVIAEAAPTGDEDQDFADMLRQFKAKVAETIPKEDAGSHYDLGLAFKEMGLLDEAIAEFQTALRGGQEKLKVFEELGNCFVQKQQYSVAVTVLNRAMQMPHDDESELLGVYYNLGRAHEELGQQAEARSAYERVISVDIGFQDTSQRLAKL